MSEYSDLVLSQISSIEIPSSSEEVSTTEDTTVISYHSSKINTGSKSKNSFTESEKQDLKLDLSNLRHKVDSNYSSTGNKKSMSQTRSKIDSHHSSSVSRKYTSKIRSVISSENGQGDVCDEKKDFLHERLDNLKQAHYQAVSDYKVKCNELERSDMFEYCPPTNQMDYHSRNRIAELEKKLSTSRVSIICHFFFC